AGSWVWALVVAAIAVVAIVWRYRVALAQGGPPPQAEAAQLSSLAVRAPPATRSPADTCTALTAPSNGEDTGISIFIASRTTSGWRARTSSPGSTSTRITVPGIGAVTVVAPSAARGRCDSTSTSG